MTQCPVPFDLLWITIKSVGFVLSTHPLVEMLFVRFWISSLEWTAVHHATRHQVCDSHSHCESLAALL